MPFTYILHSQKLNRFYIGATQNDLLDRITKHNQQLYGTKAFIAAANDWTLFLYFEVQSYDHALRIEKKIKLMKSAQYTHNIKKHPDLKAKIILESKN